MNSPSHFLRGKTLALNRGQEFATILVTKYSSYLHNERVSKKFFLSLYFCDFRLYKTSLPLVPDFQTFAMAGNYIIFFREAPKDLLSTDYFSVVRLYYSPMFRRHTHKHTLYQLTFSIAIE